MANLNRIKVVLVEKGKTRKWLQVKWKRFEQSAKSYSLMAEKMLHGSTMKSLDDVSILVGMDMLSNSKIHFEPYNYDFKYKIIFI